MLCFVAGAVYAAVLYFRDRQTAGLSPTLRTALATLRFAGVAIIVFLLLGPLIRNIDVRIEQPIVVIAADNSSSLVLGPDSASVKESYPAMLRELSAALGDQYQVVQYTFGEDTKEGDNLDFKDPITDMSNLLQSVKNRYANRNIGALVLATDGLYNRGSNPRYSTGGLSIPIYSIALGDTSVKRDARISEVAINRIAFLGNKFPIEAVINADKLNGRDLKFTISRQGKELYNETLKVGSENFTKTIRAVLDADKPGTHQYILRIAPIDGEVTFANNTRSVFIEVIDSRQKVLLLANSPHPDLFALRQAISGNENYKVETKLLDDFDGDFEPYNLVVLHQIPDLNGRSESIRTKLLQSDIPILAIIGSQTDLPMLPRTGLGIDLSGFRNSYNDVGASINQSFSSFKIDDELSNLLKDAPPIRIPFGSWRIANSSEVVLNQKIGNISTSDPLLVINQVGDRKTAAFIGEGIWRWRIYDFATAKSHERFDKFIGNLVQFLALKADKRKFRLQYDNSFMENDRIVISAELYNDAYEPINDPEVQIDVTDDEGNNYPFTFSRTAQAYRLDAGYFPVGNYTFVASAKRGSEILEERGNFIVKPFALEAASLTADHRLLYNLANSSGGIMTYPNDAVADLSNALLTDKPLKPTSYTTEILSPVLNFKWIFALLLALVSIEWFARKRSGIY